MVWQWVENMGLKRRYGSGLEIATLSDAQRAFLLHKEVRDHRDPMGNYTVQLTSDNEYEADLAFTDVHGFNNHDGVMHWSDYASKRNEFYKKEMGLGFPVRAGSHESLYKLDDDSLVSITIRSEDKRDRSERKPRRG